MFTSPTPRATPRKSAFRTPGSALRAGTSATIGNPSLYSDRVGRDRDLATPSRTGGPRVLALRGASPTRSVASESVRTIGGSSGRYDVGEYEKVYIGRDDRMGLTALGGLPREVQEVVDQAGRSGVQVAGHVDISTGYAFVVSNSACHVWNYAKRTQASPTVYTFPAPSRVSALFASLHSSGGPEPGLILVSSDGQVHMWDSLEAALAKVDRFHTVKATLEADEQVERICCIDNSSYLITTTHSRAFRLVVSSQGGRQTPSIAPLVRSSGMFSRASPVLFSAEDDRQGISSIAVHGKEVWLVARKMAQKWSLADGGARMVQEQDIDDLIGKEAFQEEWNTGNIDLRICDMAHAGSNRFAAVVSHVNQVSSSATSPSYALIILNTAARSGLLVVESSIQLGYQPGSRSFIESPQVQMHGQVALIQFSDVVVTLDTSPASAHEDIITLKTHPKDRFDRFIGSSISVPLSKHASNGRVAQNVSAVLMPAAGGLIGVELSAPPIILERKSEEAKETDRLKSKMEQAVFYGDRRENPLSFDVFDSVPEADVAEAAIRLSDEILTNDSKHMPAIYELRPFLHDRLDRLRQIMAYIANNGLMYRVSQSARQALLADAEKANAAIKLWEHQDKLMGAHNADSPETLLSDSIKQLMYQYGASDEDDVVRQFFRSHISHLEQVLAIVFGKWQRVTQETLSTAERAKWVAEVDRIFITVIQAATTYSKAETETYDFHRHHPQAEIWTATDPIVDATEALYHATTSILSDRTRELGTVIDRPLAQTDMAEMKKEKFAQNELKELLAGLAGPVLVGVQDKVRLMAQRQQDGYGGDEDAALRLERRWTALKPAIIRPLVEYDLVASAYSLAEQHKDWETLVWLCHSHLAPNAGAGGGEALLRKYIKDYEEDFAFVLYQWYIDQNQQHALLSQDTKYYPYVTEFFDTRGYPELAWMHHLACGRWGDGAVALRDVQDATMGQDDRTLLASIGKLAAVADVRTQGPGDDDLLGAFDNSLGSLQLQAQLKSRILSSGTRRTHDPIAHYLSTCTYNLDDRPAFKGLLRDLMDKLCSGQVLNVEELVDVLTLKENRGEAVGDAVKAMDRLARAGDLPGARRSVALLSIWRRVFIQDDWAVIANTSGRSEEAQRRLLMSTATYATMDLLHRRSDFPRQFILDPLSALSGPQTEELVARFPHRSPEEIQSLLDEHEAEITLLERYVNEHGLEARAREVGRLVSMRIEEEERVRGGKGDSGDEGRGNGDDEMSGDGDDEMEM